MKKKLKIKKTTLFSIYVDDKKYTENVVTLITLFGR